MFSSICKLAIINSMGSRHSVLPAPQPQPPHQTSENIISIPSITSLYMSSHSSSKTIPVSSITAEPSTSLHLSLPLISKTAVSMPPSPTPRPSPAPSPMPPLATTAVATATAAQKPATITPDLNHKLLYDLYKQFVVYNDLEMKYIDKINFNGYSIYIYPTIKPTITARAATACIKICIYENEIRDSALLKSWVLQTEDKTISIAVMVENLKGELLPFDKNFKFAPSSAMRQQQNKIYSGEASAVGDTSAYYPFHGFKAEIYDGDRIHIIHRDSFLNCINKILYVNFYNI